MPDYLESIRSLKDDNSNAEQCALEIIDKFLKDQSEIPHALRKSQASLMSIDFFDAEKNDLIMLERIIDLNKNNENLQILLTIKEQIKKEIPAEELIGEIEKTEEMKDEKSNIIPPKIEKIENKKSSQVTSSSVVIKEMLKAVAPSANLLPENEEEKQNRLQNEKAEKLIHDVHSGLSRLTNTIAGDLEIDIKNQLLELLKLLPKAEKNKWFDKKNKLVPNWKTRLDMLLSQKLFENPNFTPFDTSVAKNPKMKLLYQNFEVCKQLTDCLKTSPNAKWSEKFEGIKSFYLQLNKADPILSQYPNPEWKMYMRKALAVLVSLLPTLGEKFFLKFGLSKGEEYKESAAGEVQKLVDNLPKTKT